MKQYCRLKICLWQFSPSLHQLTLVEALSKKCDLIWVIENKDLDVERSNMGWSAESNIPIRNLSTKQDMKDFVTTLNDEVVHIFGGLRSSNNLEDILVFLINDKRRVFVQSEAPNYFGVKGFFRILRGYYDNLKYFKKIEGIFAIGSLGVNYFNKIFIKSSKIFPWGYFVKKREYSSNLRSESNSFQLLFVGRLIKTKGVDVLLKSLINIPNDFKLRIIGNGPEEDRLKQIVNTNINLKSRVLFQDFMKNNKVLDVIGSTDLLLLPSVNKDGWGAVVSEALMQGTPVISSDKCGSSVLIKNSERGAVVRAGSVKQLHDAIIKQINKGKVTITQKQKIIQWSACISGDVAAQYMLDSINNKKPKAPWID